MSIGIQLSPTERRETVERDVREPDRTDLTQSAAQFTANARALGDALKDRGIVTSYEAGHVRLANYGAKANGGEGQFTEYAAGRGAILERSPEADFRRGDASRQSELAAASDRCMNAATLAVERRKTHLNPNAHAVRTV